MTSRILVALAMLTLVVARADGGEETTCRIEAWSRDPDAAGLRVRAGPAADAAVLGRLPPVKQDEDGRTIGPTFRIVGARNGWLKIADAVEEDGTASERPFPRAGWVHGSLAGLSAQSARGYAEPSPTGRPSVDLGSSWLLPDRVLSVLSCSGEWAQLRIETGNTRKDVWFRGICANQWTTCDGRDVDR